MALLRSAAIHETYSRWIHRCAAQDRESLRKDLEARLDEVHRRANASAPITIRAVRDLLELERAAAALQPLDVALGRVLREVERTEILTHSARQQLLEAEVQQLIGRYNVEAGRNTPTGPSVGVRAAGDFGARYVEAREDLLGFLANLRECREDLDLAPAEDVSLKGLAETVRENRLEIALLGIFSSGKSALINALLGVPVDDRSPKLLPTSVRVETATVNRIEHADATVLRKVAWLESVSLSFLTATNQRQQFFVHVEEMTAFERWVSRGEVSLEDCVFETVEAGHHPTATNRPAAAYERFRTVCQALGFPAPQERFAYGGEGRHTPALPPGPIPVRVEVRRFRRPARWPTNASAHQAFELVKDPAIALRIGALHIGFNHPLLRHVTIIDTPGTDAPIPHHRKVARGIVRDKACPVIYCFLGVRACVTEDVGNLAVMKEWGIGKTDLARFFFVITQKGQVAPEGQREVRDRVKANLAAAEIPVRRLYFTEVVEGHNDEFVDLKRDIGRFVEESRGPMFRSWIASARRVVDDVRQRHASNLDAMAEDARANEARSARLEREARAAGTAAAALEGTGGEWGTDWAFVRLARATSESTRQVDELIESLLEREDFAELEARLASSIEEVNRVVSRAVRSTYEAVAGKLSSVLATDLAGRRIEVPPLVIEDDIYPSASVLETAGRLEWKGFWSKLVRWVIEPWTSDVDANRARIAGEWASVREVGDAIARSLLGGALEYLRLELRRLSDGIALELKQSGRRDDPAGAAVIERRRRAAETWVRRLDDLGKNFEAEERL